VRAPPEVKVRAPLKHTGAIFIRHSRKKGGPKAAPSPAHLERTNAARGFATVFAFKARPKGLQRAGCITMTPRINAVNSGAAFEPAHL
jgi:hypothetical protein